MKTDSPGQLEELRWQRDGHRRVNNAPLIRQTHRRQGELGCRDALPYFVLMWLSGVTSHHRQYDHRYRSQF